MANLTLNSLYFESVDKLNHLVGRPDDFGRLIGVAEDEEDFYYIIKNKNGSRFYKTYQSACVNVFSLKDHLTEEEYRILDEQAIADGLEHSPVFQKIYMPS